MNLKVDLPEVIALSDKISQGQQMAESSLNVVKNEIGNLNAMESFKGESAEISKYYFSELHETIIHGFQQLLIEINRDADKNVNNFLSAVDSSEGAKIFQSYVEEQKESIETVYSSFETLSQNVHQTIDSVSDLVSVSKPNFSEVSTKKNILIRIMTDLVDNMGNFSNQANSDELREMLNHIKVLVNNAQAKAGEERYTEFYTGESKKAKANLDKWVDSKRDKTTIEKVYAVAQKFRDALKYSSHTNTLAQAGIIAYIVKHMGLHEAKRFLRTGKHAFDKRSYVRYNNLLSLSNLYRIPNGTFKNFLRQVTKERVKPVQALKNVLPYKNIKNPSLVGEDFGEKLLKHQFASIVDLKKYQEFNKLAPGEKAKRVFKTFGNELVGNNIKTAKKLIKQTNWKKPQSLIVGTVKEVKEQTKGLNVLGKIGKFAGPLGAGLHITDNFNQHKGNPQKIIVGSAVDIGGSSLAAASGAAVGSLLLPPIGTVVGAAVGVGIGYAISKKFGKPPKSVLDHTKDKVNKTINKIAGWFK